MKRLPMLSGDEVLCFPDQGPEERGYVQTILKSATSDDPLAYIVEHGEEKTKKTWLAEQLLPMCIVPDGLLRLLAKRTAPQEHEREWFGSHNRPIQEPEQGPPMTVVPPGAKHSAEPLFLAFDASEIDQEHRDRAKGNPFMGPDRKKLGDILEVQGNDLIIEVDSHLADSVREQLAKGLVPPRCREYRFPKKDVPE